jgi:predicted RNA-binding Zn-ribbon protein involved in translation (DUF1610 family)
VYLGRQGSSKVSKICKGGVEMNCANCGNDTFYKSAAPNSYKMKVGEKYVCVKCGFKGTVEMHTKGNVKKRLK